jgi:hypothetical protein
MASGLVEFVETKSTGSRNHSGFAAMRSNESPSGYNCESGKVVKGGWIKTGRRTNDDGPFGGKDCRKTLSGGWARFAEWVSGFRYPDSVTSAGCPFTVEGISAEVA